jgi:hypothetical protein
MGVDQMAFVHQPGFGSRVRLSAVMKCEPPFTERCCPAGLSICRL